MKTSFSQTLIPLTLPLLLALAAAPLAAQTTLGSTTPNPSAELDVQSTTRGMLPPRMSTAQRNAIATPAKGLLVFNTTLNCIEVNLGTPSAPAWGCLILANTASPPSATPTVCRSTALTPITHTTTGATGIGTATGLPSGVTASWASNTITISGTPSVAGTYNYSIPLTGGMNGGQASGTITVAATNTVTAVASTLVMGAGRAVSSTSHTTTGATGIGTATGLPAGITASWASNTITISGTPTASGTFNYTVPLSGGCGSVNATGTLIIEPFDCGAFIADGVWKTFKCHNLGADASANPFTPDWKLNGSYYQWGRLNPSASAPTGTSSAQANSGAISGWSQSNVAGDAWTDASKTGNDPCPAGFRVPTEQNWAAVANTTLNPDGTYVGSWVVDATNYSSGMRIGTGNSGLYLPAAGVRRSTDGILLGRGDEGDYWSSTQVSTVTTNSWFLYFRGVLSNRTYPVSRNASRVAGMSVRCIAL